MPSVIPAGGVPKFSPPVPGSITCATGMGVPIWIVDAVSGPDDSRKRKFNRTNIRPETVTFATVRYGAIAGLFRNRTTVASLAGDFSSTGPSRFPLGHSSGYA